MSLKKKYPHIPGAGQPPYIDWSKVDPFPDTSGIENDEIEDGDEEDDEIEDEVEGEQECSNRFFSWLFGK